MSITIDGTPYDVSIISLSETCEFLDKYAERTEDGVLHRELIGVYFNQQITFGTPVTAAQRAEYASFWTKLSEATEFHTVTVPDVDGVDFTFIAYFSNVKRVVQKWKAAETNWSSITVNFTAQSPESTP